MTREETIALIKPHEAEMRAAGMAALYLFGSTARGEANAQSDVDLACDIDKDSRIGLIELIEMQMKLEEFVGRPVDLVERAAMRPRIAKSVNQDAVQVF